MSATEESVAVDAEGELLRSLESAAPLPTLRPDTMPEIRVKWLRRFGTDGTPEWADWVMPATYPFTTIDDIKNSLALYAGEGQATWLPKFVFLGVPLGTADQPAPTTRYIPADYLWFPPGEKGTTRSTLQLPSPLALVANASLPLDRRFVDNQGNAMPLEIDLTRARLTVETAFILPRDGHMPILHAFPLHLLLRQYPGQTPVGEAEWNGRFLPYFPTIRAEDPKVAGPADQATIPAIRTYITTQQAMLGDLNDLLEAGEPLYPLRVSGIHQLRLTWPAKKKGFEGCESLFYRLNTTTAMPFMRLIPSEGAPIVKVHTRGPLPIPDIAEPHLIARWANELSPIPGSDYLCIKVLVRPQLYATIRIFNDGTADILVYPPKGGARLDPVADVAGRLLPAIQSALANTHLAGYMPDVGEIAVHLVLRVSPDDRLMTAEQLYRRVAGEFAPIFQRIPWASSAAAAQGQGQAPPLATIRYKLMDQFASQDKIFTYITLSATLQSMEGELLHEKLVEDVVREFNVPRDYAIAKVVEWDSVKDQYTVVAPETGVFMETFNAGVDVVIRPGALKSYEIDVYRVNSLDTLARVYTFLALLLRSSEETLEDVVEAGEQYEMAAAQVEDLALSRGAVGSVVAAAPIAEVVGSVGAVGVVDELAIDDFGDEEPVVARAAQGKLVAAAVAAPQVPGKPAAAAQETEGVLADAWFINRLKKYDPKLFSYTPTINKSYGYSRKCAANEDRQPAVLSQEEYDTMINIYENDTDMVFIVYPIKNPADAEPPIGVDEVITVLRYGSSPSQPNYYLCPPLFCLRDNIVVREKDFAATKDRRGKPKLANTCPFCGGKEITEAGRKKATKGYTVIRRKNKPKNDKPHKYIGFLSTSQHPDDLEVPCCYVKNEVLHYSGDAFRPFREYETEAAARIAGVDVAAAEEAAEAEEEAAATEARTAPVPLAAMTTRILDYSIILQRLSKENILKFAKHPIPAARFGLLPPGLDAYFQQKSTSLVDRVVQQTLTSKAQGFLRMGIDNQNQNESLLAALAPLMFKTAVDEVRAVLMRAYTPHVFIASHYGNLVHEFFSPGDEEPRPDELRQFAAAHLAADVNDSNRFALSRMYRSYSRFLDFLEDPQQKKELRHITPILAEPGLVFPRGLNLVILGVDPVRPDDMPVVRCPSLGVSSRHAAADTAFMTRDPAGNYEVVIYTDNRPAAGTIPSTHDVFKEFQAAARPSWPAIVKQRVDEFFKQCTAEQGRGAFTSQQGVNPMALIPVERALAMMPTYPFGCVRDIYNHIAALTFRAKPGKAQLVAIPVVDDGTMPVALRLHFDWDDYVAAPVDDVLQFYRDKVEPVFNFYPGYKVKYVVRHETEDRVVAVQLENGIFVPAAAARDPAAEVLRSVKVVTVKEMEWQQNKAIVQPSDGDPSVGLSSTRLQMEELYQNFRLSVAGWISSAAAGPAARKAIEGIIFRADLPNYEKRKRLEITIGGTLRSWMTESDAYEYSPSLIRRDCRMITDAGVCGGVGVCKWVPEGRCMLHVPTESTLGSVQVQTTDLFVGRVIDELCRFYEKRRQLMNDAVSRLATVTGAVHIGDQYIVPQGTPAWTQMLQMEWAVKKQEEPRFFEELSSVSAIGEEVAPTLQRLPAGIAAADSSLRLWLPGTGAGQQKQPILPLLPLLGTTYSELGLTPDAGAFTAAAAMAYVRAKKVPIMVVSDEGVTAYRPLQGAAAAGTAQLVPIVYSRGGAVGLVVEGIGRHMVAVGTLSGELAAAWNKPRRVLPVAAAAAPAVVAAPRKPLRVMRREPAEIIGEEVAAPAAAPEVASAAAPKKMTIRNLLAARKAAAAATSEALPVPEVVPEVVPEAVPEAAPEAAPEAVPEAAPVAAPEAAPEAVPVAAPKKITIQNLLSARKATTARPLTVIEKAVEPSSATENIVVPSPYISPAASSATENIISPSPYISPAASSATENSFHPSLYVPSGEVGSTSISIPNIQSRKRSVEEGLSDYFDKNVMEPVPVPAVPIPMKPIFPTIAPKPVSTVLATAAPVKPVPAAAAPKPGAKATKTIAELMRQAQQKKKVVVESPNSAVSNTSLTPPPPPKKPIAAPPKKPLPIPENDSAAREEEFF